MWKNLTKTLHLPVFIPSILIILAITLICSLFPQASQLYFNEIKQFISQKFGWFYILSVSLFIIFLLLISGSRLGDIKLGNDDERPEYSFISWIAMLFASGMGIGLMYFGVAEPLSHYVYPLTENSSQIEKTQHAILLSFYHWGFHAWAIYAVMGLALAYFGFRYKQPLTIRSGFYPLLKEHSNKMCGDIIDIIALFSTVFGLCTSLGFGSLQLSAGLSQLHIIENNNAFIQIILIGVIMAIVACSTLVGVAKGMKLISELNLFFAISLLIAILILGPTLFLFSSFTENIGFYIKSLIELSFKTFAYETDKQAWFSDWTVLYWAWWLSWAPFVGLFIAKISRGRTVREFILGVLFIPSLFNFLWMSIFGNSAIWIDKQTQQQLTQFISNSSELLFHFLKHYPFSDLLSNIALIVITLFFITSADSGIHVINSISSKGKNSISKGQSFFWIILISLLSSSLIFSGGLNALQTMTLIITLPFCLIMLLLCIGIWKGMLADNLYYSKKFTYASRYWKEKNWKAQLNKIIVNFTEKDVEKFIQKIAKPSFHLFALELNAYGIKTAISSDYHSFIEIRVEGKDAHAFIYGIRCVAKEIDNQAAFEPVSYFADGREGYDVKFMNSDELITDILKQYELYLSLVNDKTHQLRTQEFVDPM